MKINPVTSPAPPLPTTTLEPYPDAAVASISTQRDRNRVQELYGRAMAAAADAGCGQEE